MFGMKKSVFLKELFYFCLFFNFLLIFFFFYFSILFNFYFFISRPETRSDLGFDFCLETQKSIFDSDLRPSYSPNRGPNSRHDYDPDPRPRLLIRDHTLKLVSRRNSQHWFKNQIMTLTRDPRVKSWPQTRPDQTLY